MVHELTSPLTSFLPSAITCLALAVVTYKLFDSKTAKPARPADSNA